MGRRWTRRYHPRGQWTQIRVQRRWCTYACEQSHPPLPPVSFAYSQRSSAPWYVGIWVVTYISISVDPRTLKLVLGRTYIIYQHPWFQNHGGRRTLSVIRYIGGELVRVHLLHLYSHHLKLPIKGFRGIGNVFLLWLPLKLLQCRSVFPRRPHCIFQMVRSIMFHSDH